MKITCSLSKIMAEKGVGVRELARDVGVSHVAIVNICFGRNLPRLDLALAISRRLKTKAEKIWRIE